MAQERRSTNIEHEPLLIKLVEEVRASGEPRQLRIGDTTVAVLHPAPKEEDANRSSGRRKFTEAEVESSRSAAGSWKDVDIDKFIEDIYASRDASISTKVPKFS